MESLDASINAQYKRGVLIPAKTRRRAFFVLDTQTGVIHIFKTLDQDKPSESFSISNGTFPEQLRIISDPDTGKVLDSFEFKTRNNLQFTVISEDQIGIDQLRDAFEQASKKAPVKVLSQQIGKGILNVIKVPWKLTKVVVYSLEKIGDGFEATPDYVFRQKHQKAKHQPPSNVASGLAYGTKSMLTNMFSAVAGVIAEPVKGAKSGGLKGGAVGFGKGILGLVCKPVKGTIDLVTQTTRGISNTPRTMYVGFSRLAKKVPKRKIASPQNPNEPEEVHVENSKEQIDPVDDIFIGEENGEHIYISRTAIKEQIRNSQVLSALLYESEKHLSAEEQIKMKQVIMRQRDLLRRREEVIKAEVDKKGQIKNITQELLNKLNEAYNQSKSASEDDQLSNIDSRDSDNSSLTDEKEIHQKLQQILQILNEHKTLEEIKLDEQEEYKVNQNENKEQFIQEVFDEASTEELQLYVVQANEVEHEGLSDAEFDQFFEDARKSFSAIVEEEEKKQSQLAKVKLPKVELTEAEIKALAKQDQFLEAARNFKGFKGYKDDYKHPDAGYYGGFQLLDNEISSRLRSAGKEILKSMGKKILSGKLNLTTISFPIKCMCPASMLELIALIIGVNPLYMNAAAQSNDPVQRLIFIMVSTIAFLFPTHQFEKPLNPILGETYQALAQDGSTIYLEQTEHRPPVTNFLIEGPKGLYRMYGWNSFVAKAWLNSAALYVEGHKIVEFQDGSKIEWNNQGDQFNNLFIGTIGHQLTGKIEFNYKEHGLYGFYDLGNQKKKTQDYFTGEIHWNGKKILDINGNYMGYMDVGGIRYFDVRELNKIYFPNIPLIEKALPSDATLRKDSVALRNKQPDAQRCKEELEELQRHDRRLREECNSRREKYGVKFENVY